MAIFRGSEQLATCLEKLAHCPGSDRAAMFVQARSRDNLELCLMPISGQSRADFMPISGQSRADLGLISGRSRADLGTISGRSRADLGAISASPNVTIVNVARRAHALDLPPATWRRSFIILHSHSFVVHFFISDAQDFVPSEFEARVYVVRGVIAHIIYSNFDRVDPDGDDLITI